MPAFANVTFRDPGPLVDRDLELKLDEKYPGDPVKGWVPTYKFGLYKTGTNIRMGNVDLRIGDTHDLRMYNGHIAYGVDSAYRGHKYAGRGVALILPLARQHGFSELWITCSPDNWPSRRTCEGFGAQFVEIVPLPAYSDMYQRGEREKCRYRLTL